jgi:hypothetical protein
MNFSINPQNNFNFNDNQVKNNLSKLNNNLDSQKIRNRINSLKNKKFSKILNNINDSTGGKFIGIDKELAPRNQMEKKLLDSAVELESMFVNMMFKSMRNTLNKEDDPLYGGMTEDIFTDMMYNEYSLLTSKINNLGLAKQMYKQNLPLIRNSISVDELI